MNKACKQSQGFELIMIWPWPSEEPMATNLTLSLPDISMLLYFNILDSICVCTK